MDGVFKKCAVGIALLVALMFEHPYCLERETAEILPQTSYFRKQEWRQREASRNEGMLTKLGLLHHSTWCSMWILVVHGLVTVIRFLEYLRKQ